MERKITVEHPIVLKQKVAASVHQSGTEGRNRLTEIMLLAHQHIVKYEGDGKD